MAQIIGFLLLKRETGTEFSNPGFAFSSVLAATGMREKEPEADSSFFLLLSLLSK